MEGYAFVELTVDYLLKIGEASEVAYASQDEIRAFVNDAIFRKMLEDIPHKPQES